MSATMKLQPHCYCYNFDLWILKTWLLQKLAAPDLGSLLFEAFSFLKKISQGISSQRGLWEFERFMGIFMFLYVCIWYLPSNFRGNQFWRIPICFDLRLESSLSTAQLLHIITIRASAPVLQDTLLIESLGFFQMLLLGSTSWYHWYPLAIRYNHGTSVAQPWQLVFLFAAPGWCIHHPPTPVASDRSIPWNCRWREGAWGDTFGVGHT